MKDIWKPLKGPHTVNEDITKEEMKSDGANNNIHDNDYQLKFALYRYEKFYLKS